MSYGRDRDAHTRGPGASASLDRSTAHRARRARELAAFEEHDRRLVRYAFGATSLATSPSGSGGGRLTTGQAGGYNTEGPNTPLFNPLPPGAGGGQTVRPSIGVSALNLTGMKQQSAQVRPVYTGPEVIIDPVFTSTVPPTKTVVVTKTPTSTTPRGGSSRFTSGGSSGGGGGSGGSSGGSSGGAGVMIDDGHSLPLVDPVVTPVPSSNRKWLVLAAVAGGLWLLARNSDS